MENGKNIVCGESSAKTLTHLSLNYISINTASKVLGWKADNDVANPNEIQNTDLTIQTQCMDRSPLLYWTAI